MKTIIMAWMGKGMAFPANLHKHIILHHTCRREIYVIVHNNAYRVVCAKQAQIIPLDKRYEKRNKTQE